MLTETFYLIGIIFIIDELRWVLAPRRRVAEMKNFPEMFRKFHHLPWESLPEAYKDNLRRKVLMFFYLVWMFIGVFGSQGLAFGLFITFNMCILNPILKMIVKKYKGVYNNPYIILQWFSAVISVIFLSLVLYNKFTSHINLWSQFKKWIV